MQMCSLVTKELSKGRYRRYRVILEFEQKKEIHFSQDVPLCSPAEESCVARAMQAHHGCLIKCTGLYADVFYSEQDNKIPDMIHDVEAKLLAMLKVGELSTYKDFE